MFLCHERYTTAVLEELDGEIDASEFAYGLVTNKVLKSAWILISRTPCSYRGLMNFEAHILELSNMQGVERQRYHLMSHRDNELPQAMPTGVHHHFKSREHFERSCCADTCRSSDHAS